MTAMRTMGLAPVLPPEASVEKTADEYVVRLAVPGFARQELEVEVTGRCVTVRGDQLEAGIDEGPFRLHERLEARFTLPLDARAEGLTAAYKHGALELHAPRTNGNSKVPRNVPIGHVTTVNPDASGV